jgi:hypothetical protein
MAGSADEAPQAPSHDAGDESDPDKTQVLSPVRSQD